MEAAGGRADLREQFGLGRRHPHLAAAFQPGEQSSAPGRIEVLRVWAAPVRLDDGSPLWLGSAQTLEYARPFDAFGLWRPRDERDADLRWPLDLQVAGPLPRLQQWLGAQGWRVQPQADWVATLGLLDDDRGPAAQPVLPATLDAEAEALLLRRAGASPDEIQVLRLWASPVRLADGTPLWLGSAQTLRYTRPFDLFGLWLPVDDHGRAHAALLQDLQGLPLRTGAHGEVAVLRVDLRAGAGTPD